MSAQIITLVKVVPYGPKGYGAAEGCPFGISSFCISGEGELFCKGMHNPDDSTEEYLVLKDLHTTKHEHLLTCYAANRIKLTNEGA